MSTPDTDPGSQRPGREGAPPAREAGLDRAVPIEGIGARLVANMTASLGIPTATSFRDIPVDAMVAWRAQLNAAIAPARLSLTHLIAYAVAQATAVHPGLAAHFVEIEGRPHRVDPAVIRLGLAVEVQGRDGRPFLVVPVLRAADELDFADFVSRYDDLVSRARANRLSPDDMAGASITLTNPGTVGTTASVPRLMPGQGAIVAIGAIRRLVGGAVMTVSSTYDHRVIQGAESGRFLATLEEFLAGSDDFYRSIADDLGVARSVVASPVRTAGSTAGSPAALAEVAAGVDLVRSFRHIGHRAADLDPLGNPPPGDEALDPATWGLTAESVARIPSDVLGIDLPGSTLAEILPELRRTYCGTIAYEVEHINSHAERAWLRRTIETGEHRVQFTTAEKIQVLERLTAVEAFERLLGQAYLGQKRFSIEGLDVIVPVLDHLIELVGRTGARTVEIGMSHRGRLSVLVNVVGISEGTILDEFERGRPTAKADPPGEGETSDVKYHRGAHGVHPTSGDPVRVTVSSNPSHLEAIDPVVEGRARAEQTDRAGPSARSDPRLAVPVLIHGDAAFAAQGVVAETFNLARLSGYTTGGTIHVIGDNQLGFTVEPANARSTDYASDLAKGFDVPITHVNADDPEACLSAVQLAVAYRERFHGDFVVHVLGYRRHGHSEEDEPAYTQPQMYEQIAQHPTAREIYMRRLVEEGAIDLAAGEAMVGAAEARLVDVREAVAKEVDTGAGAGPAGEGDRSGENGDVAVLVGPSRRGRRSSAKARPTAVRATVLRAINDELLRVPAGFTIHPKLAPQLERRREALGSEGRIVWAHAEALALASLLTDGVPIRMTGQDTERGTFSQRHLVLHDAAIGGRFTPIEHLSEARASIELYDSPLSELACLGFEYGYAVEAPDALVIWEAQYGDFANGGEVVIDQFVIGGLAKWGETSRLTLLLPHGYEGQGPEHSSARLERFLALGAEDNVRVANCTTPAQYFHLLRDQALRPTARPLVLMAPKSLLRLPAATSSLDQLTSGRFEAVLDDPERAVKRDGVRRLVLCSGRFYYDLFLSPRRAEAKDVAVARVELLYPFPCDEVRRLLAGYPDLETVVWAQEEPRNMGARKFVLPEIRDVIPPKVALVDVSRPERSSPAEGYAAAHWAQQRALIGQAFG
ncbi:MAG TPA: multifunctional oxoglutarate decarboxylase/oxoglutarate dehydrogenase thiamine pyrophosphate-binding subunit/dihydrolipoyllysine-residue succinyltransferase subunit [Candidatus Limnocylindrales bacterium]